MIAEIQSTIAAEKDEIRRRYRAEIKGIFGSYARGDFHTDSWKGRYKTYPYILSNPIIAQILKDLEEEIAHGQNRMA